MANKIEFKDNKWESGIRLPDRLIALSPDEKIKLLEAFNVDWKNINLPWAKLISKWNGAGVDPSSPNIDSDIESAITDFNEQPSSSRWNNTNKVDWIHSDYNFLKEHEYNTIPGWSKNGRIEKSEDIVEVLDYLIWRVIVLDYFTKYWNNRNSKTTEHNFILGWNGDLPIDLNRIKWNEIYYYIDGFADENSQFNNIILTPTIDRFDTPLIANNATYLDIPVQYRDNVFPMYISTSNGNVNFDELDANIGEISIQSNYSSQYNYNNTIWYKYIISGSIHGTWYESNYPSSSDGLNAYKQDDFSTYVDPFSISRLITLNQDAGSIQTGTGEPQSMEEVHDQLTFTITKTFNKLNSLSINGVEIQCTPTSKKCDGVPDNDYYEAENNDNIYTIPFKLNVPNAQNNYEINIEADYGKEYGIYPYFFIKEGNKPISEEIIDSESGLFNSSTCTYGNIHRDDNKYYFSPDNEPEDVSDDITITICCMLYYANTNLSRQVNPIYIEFPIRLSKIQDNEIIFKQINTLHWGYSIKEKKFKNIMSPPRGSSLFNNENSKFVSSTNVKYAIVDYTYNTVIDGDDPNLLNFSYCITTKCSSDFTVEYKGTVSSNANDCRTFDLENNILTHIEDNTIVDILDENTLKLGSGNNSFKYVYDDPAKYYSLNSDTINELSESDLIDTDLTTNENDGLVSGTGKKFRIKSSTATYPEENGLIINEGSVDGDADNDYDFLVFKISAEEGIIHSIAYKACVGYLFLRVFRNSNIVTLALNPASNNEIYYDVNNTQYSMRTQVRQMIFLNRLFTSSSQDQINVHGGKKYWAFYNADENVISGSSSKWDDKVVAINNKLSDEEYIKIYNEGDKYNAINYGLSSKESRRNPNTYVSSLEDNRLITLQSVSGAEQRTVGEFNGNSGHTNSGAILWVNKLMKAVYEIGGDRPQEYVAVNGSGIGLDLIFTAGNSKSYSRLSPVKVTVFVYKQKYDIELTLNTNGNDSSSNNPAKIISTYSRPIQPLICNLLEQPITPVTINSGNDIVSSFIRYCTQLFLSSEEFGLGSHSWQDNDDTLAINLNSVNIPVINVTNFTGTTINTSVSISNINNTWVSENNGYFNSYDDTKCINIIYFPTLNDNANNSFKRGFSIVPMSSTGNTPQLITFTISGDPDGIYDDKIINIYIQV